MTTWGGAQCCIMMTASVAPSSAVAAYYTEQKIHSIGTNTSRYVLTIIKVQWTFWFIIVHNGNVFTVPVPIKTFAVFCQCTYTSKPFKIMFNGTWYPFFTKKPHKLARNVYKIGKNHGWLVTWMKLCDEDFIAQLQMHSPWPWRK